MGGGARQRALVLGAIIVASVLLLSFAPAPAAAGQCKSKPGRRFAVKATGNDDYQGDSPSGHRSQTYKWSAKFKAVRMTILRCDGKLRTVTLDANDGKIKTSLAYTEPDIVTDPGTCDSDFLCPRGAHAAATEKGCRFKHSGTYPANFHVSAYFGGKGNVVISAGPRGDTLDKEEKQTQRKACGDTFRFGTLPVRDVTSDGLDWDIDGYFLSATAEGIPAIVRSLAGGHGIRAAASGARTDTSNDGKVVDVKKVSASLTIGDGGGVKNRFPDDF